jgi:hypothetical protein
MTTEEVKYFNADGTETIAPLEDILAVATPEYKASPLISVLVILGSMLIVCGTLIACVWILTSQL